MNAGSAIGALLAKCPDRATESVLADWCEENGRAFLIAPLRSPNAELRAAAVAHLAAADISAEAFRAAWNLFRLLGEREWDRLATSVTTYAASTYEPEPYVYFATGYEMRDRSLHTVTWAMARDLLANALPEKLAVRALPIAAVMREACKQCGHEALLVGADSYRTDGAGDPAWSTDLFALCLFAPHVELLATSTEWYQRAVAI